MHSRNKQTKDECHQRNSKVSSIVCLNAKSIVVFNPANILVYKKQQNGVTIAEGLII